MRVEWGVLRVVAIDRTFLPSMMGNSVDEQIPARRAPDRGPVPAGARITTHISVRGHDL